MKKSIHDNELLKYQVNVKEKTITFDTKWEIDKEQAEYTEICFINVHLHYFQDISYFCNIFFDIEEYPVEIAWKSNVQLFGNRKNYGWPSFIISDPRTNPIDAKRNFIDYLEKNKLKYYNISASCGLFGWVIASDCKINVNT